MLKLIKYTVHSYGSLTSYEKGLKLGEVRIINEMPFYVGYIFKGKLFGKSEIR